MRITIDTKHDSKEEIRKAIELLRSVLEQSGSSGDMFSNSGGYQDMFGNNSPQPAQPQQSSGSMFDIFNTPAQEPSSPSTGSPTLEKPKPKKPSFMGFEMYE